MNSTFSAEEKIKVININKKFIDIQYVNILELDNKYEDHRSKNEFLIIAEKLQKYPFLYESTDIEISDTLLIRDLLFNPALIPIITLNKKEYANAIYTRTPIKKECLSSKLELRSIPSGDQIYINGIVIDSSKNGSLVDKTNTNLNVINKDIEKLHTLFNIPEYIDDFNQKHDLFIYKPQTITTDFLKLLLQQIRYVFNFYQSVIGLYICDIIKYDNIPYKEFTNIISWYNNEEINYIKFLIKDDRKWLYNLDPIEALGSNFDLLLYILIEGTTSVKIKEYFELVEINTNRKKEFTKLEIKKIKSANVAKRFLIIIGNKFGSDVQQHILKSLSAYKYMRLPGGSLALPSTITNITNIDDILNLLTEQQQNIVKVEYNKQEEYIKSVQLNKCQHVTLLKKLIKSNNYISTKEIFNKLIPFFDRERIINGFIICKLCDFSIICEHKLNKIEMQINNVPPKTIMDSLLEYAIKIKINKVNEYYCKYCGEKLIKDLFIEEHDIKQKSSITFTETEKEINDYLWSVIMNALSKNSSDIIGNEKQMAIYISNTIKSITYTDVTDLSDNNKLLLVLYVYAYLLHIIISQNISLLGINTSLPISKMAEKILVFIYDRYKKIINSVNITVDNIKTQLTNCYNNLFKRDITIPINNTESDIAKYVFTIDPIYHYANKICKLLKKIPSKINLTPLELKNEFELIVGNSIPNIIKEAKENIKNPKYSDIIKKKFGTVLHSETLEYFHKNKNLNFYENIYTLDESILISFLSGKYENYFYAAYIMLCKYIKDVDNNEKYKDFYELLQKFKRIEDEMFLLRYKKSYKPYFLIKYKDNSHFKKQDISITQLYDETGQKHKWNVFLYDSNHHIIEVTCSICKIKFNEFNKLDINKTWRSIISLFDIDAFYNFYKIRCPATELHNWKNNICIKCGLDISFINLVTVRKINSDILKYYDKYLSTFIQEKNKYNVLDYKEDLIKEEPISSFIISKYEYNYTIIVKLSEITGILPNIIESIGLMEGRKFSDIENKINEPTINQNHIYNAYSELINLLSKSGNKLDYLTNINAIFNNYPITTIHKYIIQSTCEIILQIYEYDKERAIELFNEVINNQKMFCEPVVFNLEILDNTDETGIYLGDEYILEDENTDYVVPLNDADYNFTEDNPNNEPNIEIKNEYIYNIIE